MIKKHETQLRWEKALLRTGGNLWAARYYYWCYLSPAQWSDEDFAIVYEFKRLEQAKREIYKVLQ